MFEVGDVVFVTGRFHNRLDVVERVTKTQVILKNSTIKYRMDTGYKVGADGWNCSSIRKATPEAVEEYKEDLRIKKIINTLSNTNWNKVSNDKLDKISRILVDLDTDS